MAVDNPCGTTTEQITVLAQWDESENVWTAWSDDVPGLVAEATTMDELAEELDTLIPLLIEVNQSGPKSSNEQFSYQVSATIHRSIRMIAAQ